MLGIRKSQNRCGVRLYFSECVGDVVRTDVSSLTNGHKELESNFRISLIMLGCNPTKYQKSA